MSSLQVVRRGKGIIIKDGSGSKAKAWVSGGITEVKVRKQNKAEELCKQAEHTRVSQEARKCRRTKDEGRSTRDGDGREKRKRKEKREEEKKRRPAKNIVRNSLSQQGAASSRHLPGAHQPLAGRPITRRRGVHGTRQESGFGASIIVTVFRKLTIRPCPF